MSAHQEEILKKLPKQTPGWAVGVISVIVSVSVSVGAMYTLARPEVTSYMNARFSSEAKAQENQRSVLDSMLSLVHTNQIQLTDLSSALRTTEQKAYELSNKVNDLEREVTSVTSNWRECQSIVKSCSCPKSKFKGDQ